MKGSITVEDEVLRLIDLDLWNKDSVSCSPNIEELGIRLVVR